jgi:hypothetical protein
VYFDLVEGADVDFGAQDFPGGEDEGVIAAD